MIFFFVHFGKNLHTGWQLARDVYGRLGSPNHWTWARTRANPGGFRQWLAENEDTLLGGDGVPRHFGNHRKYESIRSDSKRPLAAVVDTYIAWIAPHGSHEALIGNAVSQNGGDPKRAFDYLYRTMDVLAFGRTGKFDYLTMLGKLHLAPIEPGIPYMTGATGPYTGARLLFGGTADAAISKRAANEMAAQLGGYLGLGMQVMEDSLCNWQKSPEVFVPFRG